MNRRGRQGSVSQPQAVTAKQRAMCRLLGFTVCEHNSMRTHPQLPVEGPDQTGAMRLWWMYPNGVISEAPIHLDAERKERYLRQLERTEKGA